MKAAVVSLATFSVRSRGRGSFDAGDGSNV